MTWHNCLYFCEPAGLVDREDIPDHIYRRFVKLLKRSYNETGTAYAYVTLSNDGLAELWRITDVAARDTLMEFRRLGLIDTEQMGRTGRIIRILVAWRGRGMDSAPEGLSPSYPSREPNEPGHGAAHVGPHATAAERSPACAGFAFSEGVESPSEGATVSRTLGVRSNDDDVLKHHGFDFDFKHHHHISASIPSESVPNSRIVAVLRDRIGIRGKNLEIIARSISVEIAATWAEWVPRARESGLYANPGAYAATVLKSDPNALPPEINERLNQASLQMRRSDFTDTEWSRMSALAQKSILLYEQDLRDREGNGE